MDPKEIYVRSLLLQYRVFRGELITFTNWFMLAILAVPVSWYVNHVQHHYGLGFTIGFVAAALGISMAVHCRNTLQSLERIAQTLNKEMTPTTYGTFEYDLGLETDKVRYYVTLVAKIIAGGLVAFQLFIKWPQL